ncbi:MAG TPA: hypothetical protein VKS22_04280 [Candidatus Binataceae bacterium]|nr:hypothetical protein [Candidatus Binataceae bacterium]
MAYTQQSESKTLTGAAERTAAAIRETVITPAEAILGSIERIAAMRLPADLQKTVAGELGTLAGEMRLKLIQESEALRRLGDTLRAIRAAADGEIAMKEIGIPANKPAADFRAALDSLIAAFGDFKRPLEASALTLERIRALPIESPEVLAEATRKCREATIILRDSMRRNKAMMELSVEFLRLERTLQSVAEGQKK